MKTIFEVNLNPVFVRIQNTVPYWDGRIGLLKTKCWGEVYEIRVPGERPILLDKAKNEFIAVD